MVQWLKLNGKWDLEVLRLAGAIGVVFSQFEHVLTLTVTRCLRMRYQDGMAIAADTLPAAALRDKVEEAFQTHVMDQKSEAELRVLLDEAEKLTRLRHSIVHELRGYARDGGPVRVWRGQDYGANVAALTSLLTSVKMLQDRLNNLIFPES